MGDDDLALCLPEVIGARVTHPLDVELADYVDETLDPATREIVEAHVVDCSLCRIKVWRLENDPDPDARKPD